MINFSYKRKNDFSIRTLKENIFFFSVSLTNFTEYKRKLFAFCLILTTKESQNNFFDKKDI